MCTSGAGTPLKQKKILLLLGRMTPTVCVCVCVCVCVVTALWQLRGWGLLDIFPPEEEQ
jgi:uncharacterized membrane protein YphA (DoxX/SURF4 family)